MEGWWKKGGSKAAYLPGVRNLSELTKRSLKRRYLPGQYDGALSTDC